MTRLGQASAHFRPLLTKKGWRTPVSGDGKGFPDVVLVKPGRPVLFIECKGKTNSLEPDQQKWRDAIEAASGCVYMLVRPDNLEDLVKVLSRR